MPRPGCLVSPYLTNQKYIYLSEIHPNAHAYRTFSTLTPTGQPAGGYTAAISQRQFGVGPGAGAGPACGHCWELTVTQGPNGQAVPQKSIKVKVDNLCPVDGNPICNVPNQYGADVHFDLCKDTGAAGAFFTNTGMGVGTASMVPC